MLVIFFAHTQIKIFCFRVVPTIHIYISYKTRASKLKCSNYDGSQQLSTGLFKNVGLGDQNLWTFGLLLEPDVPWYCCL